MDDYLNFWLNQGIGNLESWADPIRDYALPFTLALLVPILIAAGSMRVLTFLFWRGSKGGN
jgi:hypothetical protein